MESYETCTWLHLHLLWVDGIALRGRVPWEEEGNGVKGRKIARQGKSMWQEFMFSLFLTCHLI